MVLTVSEMTKRTAVSQIIELPFPMEPNIFLIEENKTIWENYKKQVPTVVLATQFGFPVANSYFQSIKMDLKNRWSAEPMRLVDVDYEKGCIRARHSAPWSMIVFESMEERMEFMLTWS